MKPGLKFDKISLERLNKAINEASKQVDDLRVPLGEIGKEFLESRKFIFALKGHGQYDDLSEAYKKRKSKLKGGSPYPILLLTGRLAKSITQEGDENIMIVGKKSLRIGTSVEYGAAHNFGNSRTPKRPFLFWGPESKEYANHRMVLKQNRAMAQTLFEFLERSLGKDRKVARRTAERKVQNLFKG